MKKLSLIIILIAFLLTSCGAIKLADVNNLSQGMTQMEVSRIMGNPVRILSTSYTQYGRQEVFEYHTYRSEVYAIEFLDGRMTGYDFMYEEVPPVGLDPGPPVYVPNRPHRPSQPNRPSQPSRPSEPSRPSQPNRPTEPSRPENNQKPGNTRPSTRPSTGNTTGRSTPEKSETTRSNDDKSTTTTTSRSGSTTNR